MKRHALAIPVLAVSLLCAVTAVPAMAAVAPAYEQSDSEFYNSFLNAYRDQVMPDRDDYPVLQEYYPELLEQPLVPKKPYSSVTRKNLQGRWVNRYTEGGSQVEEILSVNGDRARIEEYIDGVPHVVWNGDGDLSIEDRSSRGVCPEVSVMEYDPEGFWLQHCGIYIRRVGDNTFFDGGFLKEWRREEPEDLWNQYLYNTVTLENLQGVWYSEYTDTEGLYRDVLHVYGDHASIFETINGRVSSIWNGDGPCSVAMEEYRQNHHVPELLIKKTESDTYGSIAGIYISKVDEDKFYDAAFDRWFVRVPMHNNYGEEGGGWEGNLIFTIYGGAADKVGDHYVYRPAEEGQRELILDEKTELVHPEQLDGWEAGLNAVQWIDHLCAREGGTGASGVYDADVTGDHIDRVYGLYWWD